MPAIGSRHSLSSFTCSPHEHVRKTGSSLVPTPDLRRSLRTCFCRFLIDRWPTFCSNPGRSEALSSMQWHSIRHKGRSRRLCDSWLSRQVARSEAPKNQAPGRATVVGNEKPFM